MDYSDRAKLVAGAPLEVRAGSKPLCPGEVKAGDVIFVTYHPSVVPGPRKVSRKYLVLKVEQPEWSSTLAPVVTCVVLYAYRFLAPGEIVDLNLSTLPLDQWGMEV